MTTKPRHSRWLLASLLTRRVPKGQWAWMQQRFVDQEPVKAAARIAHESRARVADTPEDVAAEAARLLRAPVETIDSLADVPVSSRALYLVRNRFAEGYTEIATTYSDGDVGACGVGPDGREYSSVLVPFGS